MNPRPYGPSRKAREGRGRPGKAREGQGRPGKAVEGQGRPWKAREGRGDTFPDEADGYHGQSFPVSTGPARIGTV